MVAEHDVVAASPEKTPASTTSDVPAAGKHHRVVISPPAKAPQTPVAASSRRPPKESSSKAAPLNSASPGGSSDRVLPEVSLPPDARCYISSLYRAEVDLARAVSTRAFKASKNSAWLSYQKTEHSDGPQATTPADSSPKGAGGKAAGLIGLTGKQVAAVRLASTSPIMMLTGGQSRMSDGREIRDT